MLQGYHASFAIGFVFAVIGVGVAFCLSRGKLLAGVPATAPVKSENSEGRSKLMLIILLVIIFMISAFFGFMLYKID